MKKIKKNQVIIAAMTVALGVAGYLNFSGNMLDLSDAGKDKTDVDALSEDTKAAFSGDMTNEHIVLEEDMYVPGDTYVENAAVDGIYSENYVYSEAEIGEEDVPVSGEYENYNIEAGEVTVAELDAEDSSIELNSATDEIGEAVLTSTGIGSNGMIAAKLNREQVRSRTQEAYLAIINGESSDSVSVEDATAAYLALAENMGKEADAETVLAAKGYPNAVVSISENSVDVIIEASELTDAARAQIEETVVRKTGCTVDQIVISCALQ